MVNTFNKDFTIGGDLTINRMGYGAMRITGAGIWGPPTDKAEAIRVLKKAVDLGINFIDTADSYGPYISEELIAEALYPYKKDLVIATKGGLVRSGPDVWKMNAKPEHLQEALEGSLHRLKLDKIDLYQLHRVDPEVPFEKIMEFLQNAQEKGLVRHVGLSEVSVDQIKQAEKYIKVVSVQNMYSIENRKWEAVLDYCNSKNMAFIPWYPLGGGNVKVLSKLDQLGKKYNATGHQIALSWLLQHSPNIVLIPGTSKVKHLEENYKAAFISLSNEDMAELEKLKEAAISG